MGVTGGQRGAMGAQRAGGWGETRESESQNRSCGGKMGSDGGKGGSEVERAQHKHSLWLQWAFCIHSAGGSAADRFKTRNLEIHHLSEPV